MSGAPSWPVRRAACPGASRRESRCAYCGKMLADAGADVVKVESPRGDPMRLWSGWAGRVPARCSAMLRRGRDRWSADVDPARHRAARRRRPGDHRSRATNWSLADIAAATGTSAVVVAITPFGTTGPYVDATSVANEFVLQAMCGSIGGRGWPGREPMQAGGRLGEWLAGTYRGGRRRGVGACSAAHGVGRSHRRLDLRGDGDRHGRRWAPCRQACSGDDQTMGQAQPRTALDRADRRRPRRLLHHHRAAVPGLPGADRSRRPDRRRRPGVVRRAGSARATSSSHGPRLGRDQDHR